MRKNIFEILNTKSIDLGKEYDRLYELFYESPNNGVGHNYTLEQVVESNFDLLDRRLIRHCISLDDFNDTYNFYFEERTIDDPNLDELLLFIEYILNFTEALLKLNNLGVSIVTRLRRLKHQCLDCLELMGYKLVNQDGLFICIENKPEALAVAEIVDDSLSYSVLEYNHFKLRGDLIAKKSILLRMHNDIEPSRNMLKNLNKSFSSAFFQLMNAFIRHNNDENEFIKEMDLNEKEKVYDELYQMWIIAKLMLDYNSEQKEYVDSLISGLNNKK